MHLQTAARRMIWIERHGMHSFASDMGSIWNFVLVFIALVKDEDRAGQSSGSSPHRANKHTTPGQGFLEKAGEIVLVNMFRMVKQQADQVVELVVLI